MVMQVLRSLQLSDVKRVVGYLLYYAGKVAAKSCDVCRHVTVTDRPHICHACGYGKGKNNWEEGKEYMQLDWDEKDSEWPFELTLTHEVADLLNGLDAKTVVVLEEGDIRYIRLKGEKCIIHTYCR